ncbi:phage holin family protein [Streptomyces sp. NBC_00670]|jgi:hypothetical protein|uniref:phage holin family protein n=1 Tax=Streptomyces sp. NBC_00670 TaxID=2975804 RepID=UPI002E33FD48|nr:phage holin family protein [Streptomyces sp. NBC_00670]
MQGNETPRGDATAGSGVGDAATRLAQDTADLARREVRAIQDEALAGLRRFGTAGVLFAGAGVCGVLTLAAAHQTLLRATESVLPRTAAAAVLTCAYATGGAGLAYLARDRVRATAEATARALEKEHERLAPETPAP